LLNNNNKNNYSVHILPRDAMQCSMCRSRVCLCLFVRSPCSTETAKRRITRTMPHDSPATLVFCSCRSRQNSNGVTPNGDAKCRYHQVKIGDFRQITRHNCKTSTVASAVNLVRRASTFVCSTFAVIQHVARVR